MLNNKGTGAWVPVCNELTKAVKAQKSQEECPNCHGPTFGCLVNGCRKNCKK